MGIISKYNLLGITCNWHWLLEINDNGDEFDNLSVLTNKKS